MSSPNPAYRLSPQQRQLWNIHGANTSLCRARLDLSIAGPLDSQVLRNALHEIVNRHEILRTSFELQPAIKAPVQVVNSSAELDWQEIDLSESTEYADQRLLEYFAAGDSFSLAEQADLVVRLIKLSPRQHLLRISLPSLCADMRTLQNLASDLSISCCRETGHAPDHDQPFQYADFSEWQHQLLEAADEDADTGKRYWLKHLLPDADLNLAFESPSTERELAVEQVSFSIAPDLLAMIERTAGRAKVSIEEFLFSCWQMLLWRYTGKSRFAVAAVVDGRKFADLEKAYGPYARALPIDFEYSEAMNFDHALTETQRRLREAEEWQEYFLPDYNEGLTASIGYEFQNGSKVLKAGTLEFCITAHEVWSYPFKLKLDCWQTECDLNCSFYFRPDWVNRKSVERIVANLQTLLKSAAANPKTPLDQLLVLSEDERQQLNDLNNTSSELPHASVVKKFEEQVQLTPLRTAVVFKEQRLTYEELNSRANQLAHYLRKLGVGPDRAVGLCVDRSAEMLIGLLGILKAGGAYVPLNPEHPASRLSYQIAETGISVLLTDSGSKAGLRNRAVKIVEVDSPQPEFFDEPSSNPAFQINLDNLCYVIYTSGSTGNPKGVAVTHQALANYNAFIIKRLQTLDRPPLHYATVSTFAADLGNTCIFPGLTSGGCLHIVPLEVVRDGHSFAGYREAHAFDVLKIVPSHLEALLSSADGADVLPRQFLILGGEALSLRLLERLREQKAQCQIINHYGPTETTVGSLTFDCAEMIDGRSAQATVPVGGPITNTEAYILDHHLEPVPFMVAGDLYLAGTGVARGYFNQPATTADRFIPNPFSRTAGGRMYRTGDRARYLANGRIEFLGRSDRQVKIRGFRIEPEEIEAILARHPKVRRCVVAPIQANDGDLRLVAYVVLSQSTQTDELRAWLGSELPDYMVPSQFITLKVLPLTPNGKVDYDALGVIAEHESVTGRPIVAPRTEFEERLASIWREMLKIETLGVTDNFFELGGHSLLVTQIVSRIRKSFCVELSLPSFFEGPTIEQLAFKIENAKAEQTARFLTQLEHISDEEAEHLLKAES